jgi:beta-lactamase class A
MLTRRGALGLAAAGLAFPARAAEADSFQPQIAALERRAGETIGVAVLDTGAGKRFGYRQHERFPMCSTFKLLLAAAILHRADTACEDLARRIPIREADLQPTSPGTKPFVGKDLPVEALCRAAMIYSDNTAANLLLKALGGPQGVTGFARHLGDQITRLDHFELELNKVAPGEVHDTTTPAAMLGNLQKLALGQALSPASRERLTGWLLANTTGGDRLKAGVPTSWKVGDKTGAWVPGGGVNDVAILWPPGRPPILVAAYTWGAPEKDMTARNAVLAEVGRLVAAAA